MFFTLAEYDKKGIVYLMDTLILKKLTTTFSVKIMFGENQRIDTLLCLVTIPMAAALRNRNLYSNINWKQVFKRKVAGDQLIIPVIAYNGVSQTGEYKDASFQDIFVYPYQAENFISCTIMRPYELQFVEAMR